MERVVRSFSSMVRGKAAGRFVSLFVVFCFVLNGLAFRAALPDEGKAVLTDILAAQSSIIRLCSLSTLPLKIVYGLMGAGNLSDGPSVPAPSKEAPKTDNHANDCAVTAPSPRLTPAKEHSFEILSAGHICAASDCLVAGIQSRPCSIPPGAWHIMFILAILSHILARSGIPSSLISMKRNFHARRAMLAGFFYFLFDQALVGAGFSRALISHKCF